MTRCRHQNGELIEWYEAAHIRDVADGQMDPEGLNVTGQIIGYEYQCLICKRVFKFNGRPKRLKWLQRIYDQYTISGRE